MCYALDGAHASITLLQVEAYSYESFLAQIKHRSEKLSGICQISLLIIFLASCTSLFSTYHHYNQIIT